MNGYQKNEGFVMTHTWPMGAGTGVWRHAGLAWASQGNGAKVSDGSCKVLQCPHELTEFVFGLIVGND